MTRLVFNRDGGKTDEFGHMSAFARLFTGEVITGLTVAQNATPNMTVQVAYGMAMVPTGSGATAYVYLVGSDAAESVTITTADASNPRRDLIVAYVDKAVTPSTGVTNNSNNMLKLAAVAGTPAAVPADPSVSDIQTAIGATNPYIILARVNVAAATTTITTTNIDNISTVARLNVQSSAGDGWLAADPITYGTNIGNKEYTVTMLGDKTATYWPGMRFKLSRAIAPPTQCADLEASSTQYASKTSPSGITFTDDISCEAWIDLESYPTDQIVIGRFDGTSGWLFFIDSTGRLVFRGYNAGSTNSRSGVSYQSIPLGQRVHIAATLDMSGSASTMYINGGSIPVNFITSGTSPTALIQAGNLVLGAYGSGTDPFDGKIADVRIWNTIRTGAQIRDNMNQQLVGNESGLVGYFKLNGNFNDSTSNANNLTAQNSASALTADNPMKSTEYAIITKVAYSSPNTTLTLYTGTDSNIPNMTLQSPYYSTNRAPYGFPVASTKWQTGVLNLTQGSQASAGEGTWYNIESAQIGIPTGIWNAGYQAVIQHNGSAGGLGIKATLSTTNNTESNSRFSTYKENSSVTIVGGSVYKDEPLEVTSQTTHYLNTSGINVSTSTIYNRGTIAPTILFAKCAYL